MTHHHQDDSDAAWWTDEEEEEDVPITKPAQRAPQQSRFREHLSWTARPDDAVLNAHSGPISLAQDTIPICLTPPDSQAQAAPTPTGQPMDVPEDADDQEDEVRPSAIVGNNRKPHPPHLVLTHTTAASPLQNLLALPSYTPMTPRGHRLAESGANSPRLAERNAALEILPHQSYWSDSDDKLKVQQRNMDEPLSATLRRLGAKRKTEVFGDSETEDDDVAAIPWRSSALVAIHQEPSHEHQSGRYPSATSTRPRKPDGWGGLRPPSDWFSHYSFGPLRSPNSSMPPPSMDLGLPMLSPKHKHKLGKKKRRAFLLGAMKRQVDEPVYATETEQGRNTWTDEVALPQLDYGSRAMSDPLQDDKEAARLKRKELRKVRFTSLLPTHQGEQKSANIDQVNPLSDHHQAEKTYSEYDRNSYPPSVHQRTFQDQPCPSVWSSSTYSVKTLWVDHRKIVVVVSLLLLGALTLAFLISTSVLSRQLHVVKVELEGQAHQVAVLSQALQKAANAASQATQGLIGSSVTPGSTVTATPTPPLLMNTTLTGRRLSALRSALAQAQASR